MRIQNKFLTILFFSFICLSVVFSFFNSKANVLAETNSNQVKNFNDDLSKASNYWAHNKLGSAYFRNGDYENAVNEYKRAIEVIKNMPGDKWPNLKKEDVDRMNQQTRIDSQIFSRYGLVEALEKSGKYEEAIQNVDWLQQNQHIKGKEELLKKKLDGMRQKLEQELQAQKASAHDGSYQEGIKSIDDAWDNIDSGNSYYRAAKYKDAAKAYERAYTIGEKALSGLKLADTYGKLGRYDDAITLLNQMIEKHQLSDTGIQDARAMIARLTANKNQSPQ